MESLVTELYRTLLSHEGREEFWEVRFWVCLDRRIHALAEKLQRIRDREIRPADDFDSEEENARGAEGVFATRLRIVTYRRKFYYCEKIYKIAFPKRSGKPYS